MGRSILMSVLRICAALLVIYLVLWIWAWAGSWKLYSYPDDGFQVKFPSNPWVGKRSWGSGPEKVDMHDYRSADSQAAYEVEMATYPRGPGDQDPGPALHQLAQGSIAYGKVTREKRITLGDVPGVEWEGDNSDRHVIGRTYLIGNYMYRSEVVTVLGKESSHAAKFLDSFAIIGTAPPPR